MHRRAEFRKVITDRAEVVVDHVEDDRQPEAVGFVDETPHIVGAAVLVRRGKEVDAVVAPAEAARKRRDRHHLERRHANIREAW